MNAKRLLRAAIVSTFLLVVVAMTALAAPTAPEAVKESIKLNRKNVTITWFEFIDPPPNKLSHEMCSAIPEGYEILNDELTASRRKVGSSRDLRTGGQVVQVVDKVKGTATDNYGNSYTWIYRNTLVLREENGVVTAKMTDYFKVGGGPAAHKLGFKWTWQYEADEINIMQVEEGGELVDFYPDFIWPTDDGATETTFPAFVPGSWKVFYDYGDFFNCDPI